VLIFFSKPSPEIPTANAQTQPSFEYIIDNDEGEESGHSYLTTNIGQLNDILDRLNSIVNEIHVEFESSGDSHSSNVPQEEAHYSEGYGDEEFKANMDIVQLPVATIIENDEKYSMKNDIEINFKDRSVRSSNILASLWEYSFIWPMELAFENHVHERFLDPEHCFLLCESTPDCNAFSVLRGLQSARCDLFSFPDFEEISKTKNKMGFSVDLRPEKRKMFQFQHNVVVPGLRYSSMLSSNCNKLSFKRIKVNDPMACFEKCMRARQCKAFFWREIDKQCSLKNHVHLNQHYYPNISSCDINVNIFGRILKFIN